MESCVFLCGESPHLWPCCCNLSFMVPKSKLVTSVAKGRSICFSRCSDAGQVQQIHCWKQEAPAVECLLLSEPCHPCKEALLLLNQESPARLMLGVRERIEIAQGRNLAFGICSFSLAILDMSCVVFCLARRQSSLERALGQIWPKAELTLQSYK